MHYDRLSALIQRFNLKVEVCDPGKGNMRVLGTVEDGNPTRVMFSPSGRAVPEPIGECVLIDARVDWGGSANPLLSAMPSTLAMPVADEETELLLRLFLTEARQSRCGCATAMSRLAEVLIIRILRRQMQVGSTSTGLIAGLADAKISRALVVMHDTPGRDWRNADLAEVAGMSLSRFCDVFRALIGDTPQGYLRGWRMTLAHQDLERGDRVQAVARRYGYTSPEALTRAFQRQYGVRPADLKRARAVA